MAEKDFEFDIADAVFVDGVFTLIILFWGPTSMMQLSNGSRDLRRREIRSLIFPCEKLS